MAFSQDSLRALYGSKAEYRRKVEQAMDALTRDGWFLAIYRDVVLADADKVEF